MDELILATINFLSQNPLLNSTQSRVLFLHRAKLGFLLPEINNDQSSNIVFSEVLDLLKYNGVAEIITLLNTIKIENNQSLENERNSLVIQWRIVGNSSYSGLFDSYIEKLINDTNYVKLDQLYIEIKGQKTANRDLFDPKAVQVTTLEDFWNNSDKEEMAKDEDVEAKDEPIIDSITNIAEYYDRFVLIGTPGSGKTTSLKKILFNKAIKVQQKVNGAKIPILVTANLFNTTWSIEELIKNEMSEWDDKKIDKSKFVVLIDGINEIIPSKQNLAFDQINALLEREDCLETSFILSSRKYSFKNVFGLPAFEIRELNPEQVSSYINAYRPDFSEIILDQLNEKPELERLSLNPLTLFMIVFVDWEKGEIPSKRGLIFRSFTEQLLDWNNKVSLGLNRITKIELLSEIAYYIRFGNGSLSYKEIQIIFMSKVSDLDSCNLLISEFCNIHILKSINPNSKGAFLLTDRLDFVHESFLEYFSAVYLYNQFITTKELPIDVKNNEWYETILMVSDFFNDEENLNLYLVYLFSGASVRPSQSLPPLAFTKNKVNVSLLAQTFSKEQFNERIDIACKVAFNIRNSSPKVYSNIEGFLQNNLLVWLQYYYNHYDKNSEIGTEIIPMERILAACAGLSSKRILSTILFTSKWRDIWLNWYNGDSKELISLIKTKFESRVESLFDNLNDFELVYELLLGKNAVQSELRVFKTRNNLESKLKENIPLKLLKKLYQSSSDLSLLERIGRQDIDYYISEFRFSIHGIEAFIGYLLSYSYNEDVQQRLLEYLSSQNVPDPISVAILTEFMDKYYAVKTVISYLNENEKLYHQNKELYKKIVNYFRNLSAEILTLRQQAFLEKVSFSSSLDFEVISASKLNLKSKSDKVYKNKYLILVNNQSYGVLIESDAKVDQDKVVKSLYVQVLNGNLMDLPEAGQVYIVGFGFRQYSSWNRHLNTISLILTENIELRDTSSWTRAFTNRVILVQDSLVELYLMNVHFVPFYKKEYYYHTEEVVEQVESIVGFNFEYIYPGLLNDRLQSFLTKVGNISPKDWLVMPKTKVKFGVILKIQANNLKVYRPTENKYRTYAVEPEYGKQFKKGDVVMILNQYVYKPSSNYSTSDLGYLYSYVVTVKEDYYFIFNPSGKDYFVHKSRSPLVQKDDTVSFYPAINLSGQNYNKPIAIDVNIKQNSEGIAQNSIQQWSDLNSYELIKKYEEELKVDSARLSTRVKLIRELKRKKDYLRALTESKTALLDFPMDFNLRLLHASVLQSIGKWSDAIELYEILIKEVNDDISLMSDYVFCLVRSKRNSKAYQVTSTYFRDKEIALEHIYLAKHCIHALLGLKGIKRLELFINKIPEELWYKLGNTLLLLSEFYEKKRLYSTSEHYLEKALDLFPSSDTFIASICFFIRNGDFSKSEYIEQMAQDHLKDVPDQFSAFKLNLCRAKSMIKQVAIPGSKFEKGQYSEVCKEILILIEHRDYVNATRLLKGFYLTSKRQQVRLKNNLRTNLNRLGYKLEDLMNINTQYSAHLDINYSEWLAIEYLFHLMRKKEIEKAQAVAKQLLKKGAEYCEVYFLLGVINARLNGIGSAIEFFRRAVDNTNDNKIKSRYLRYMLDLLCKSKPTNKHKKLVLQYYNSYINVTSSHLKQKSLSMKINKYIKEAI